MTELPVLPRETRGFALVGIALCGVLASGILGGTTNAVNGWVSPTYFVTILGWRGVGDVWRASIAQGVFEGLVFGIFFSLIFTVGTGLITELSCSFGFALPASAWGVRRNLPLLGIRWAGGVRAGDSQP